MKSKVMGIFCKLSLIVVFILFFQEIYAMSDSEYKSTYSGLYILSGASAGSTLDTFNALSTSSNPTVDEKSLKQLMEWKNDFDEWNNEGNNPETNPYKNIARLEIYKLNNVSTVKKNSEIFEKMHQNNYKYYDGSTDEYLLGKPFIKETVLTINKEDGSGQVQVPYYIFVKYTTVGGDALKLSVNSMSEVTTYMNQFSSAAEEGQKQFTKYGYSDKDFWGQAAVWFKTAKGYSSNAPTQTNDIVDIFGDMINVVGTTVIVIATIVLGIKYVIGTVDSKVNAKEGLVTLLIACIFFFGWSSISNLLYDSSNNFVFTSDTDMSYSNMVGRIFATFTYIANIVIIIAIIYVGVKYIFAGAEGRSELKSRSPYLIIGIILAFATTNVLTFISKVIQETLK